MWNRCLFYPNNLISCNRSPFHLLAGAKKKTNFGKTQTKSELCSVNFSHFEYHSNFNQAIQFDILTIDNGQLYADCIMSQSILYSLKLDALSGISKDLRSACVWINKTTKFEMLSKLFSRALNWYL